ncbi:carbohydrate-binding domain-containing protein, partial [Azospirillum picis]
MATTSGNSTIIVTAKGAANAHFDLLVDGRKIGEGTTGDTAKDFVFKTDIVESQAHKVQVQYDNDGIVHGTDRNLFVDGITINGKSILPTDDIVSYDKGALDGRDVVDGRDGLWWNGTLVVDADKSFFAHGGAEAPSTPAPTPTPAPAPGTPPQTSPEPPVDGSTPGVPKPTGPGFYVAENGNDSWSGKLAAPNADGTDGPFASLQKAQSAMRSSDIDTTYVRGGDYHLKSPL